MPVRWLATMLVLPLSLFSLACEQPTTGQVRSLPECGEGLPECPARTSCDESIGYCLPDELDTTPPALVGESTITPAVARVGTELRSLRAGGREPDGRALEVPFGLALAVALLALDLSGKILGETGRIWLFLMPFAALAAASARGGLPFRSAVVLAAAQLPVLLAMRAVLNVPG